jgi:hypothetical protein
MSNVSDTDEIVAARLLFPLARIILMRGGRPLSRRFQPAAAPPIFLTADAPAAGGPRPRRFSTIGERKALAWSEHLYQRPKMCSEAAELPETMHIGNNG